MKTSLLNYARLCGALVLATASVACSGVAGTDSNAAPAPATPVAGAPAPAAPAGTPRDMLKAAIGDAACDSAAQCRTVPVGSKACGGPEGYLAYSTKSGNADKIVQLAAADTAQRKKADERSGMVSNCMMVVDPGATCSAGRCVTGGNPEALAR